jgi:CRP-like cAMP-binding protein
MPSLKDVSPAFGNDLLRALPREEYARLSPHLELVRLTPGDILYHAGGEVRHAYFPKGGMLSLLSITESGRTIEVAMIGNEGMAGIPIILGSAEAPYQVMVQLSGNALRVRGEALRAEFGRGGGLHDLLLRYTHALLTQVAQSAACNRFHSVEERLCRWLLMCRDHVRTDTIRLTQEFLSHMLGAPRSSVTAVAVSLQNRGLIMYSRGKITVLDRHGLEVASCECYRLVRDEFRNFLAA